MGKDPVGEPSNWSCGVKNEGYAASPLEKRKLYRDASVT